MSRSFCYNPSGIMYTLHELPESYASRDIECSRALNSPRRFLGRFHKGTTHSIGIIIVEIKDNNTCHTFEIGTSGAGEIPALHQSHVLINIAFHLIISYHRITTLITVAFIYLSEMLPTNVHLMISSVDTNIHYVNSRIFIARIALLTFNIFVLHSLKCIILAQFSLKCYYTCSIFKPINERFL